MGELDDEKFTSMNFTKRPYAEMVALLNQRRQQQERQSSMKVKVLAAQGFSVDSADFE